MNAQDNDGSRRAVQTLVATIVLLGFIALGCIAVLYDGGPISLPGQGLGYALAHPAVRADRGNVSPPAPLADRASIIKGAPDSTAATMLRK